MAILRQCCSFCGTLIRIDQETLMEFEVDTGTDFAEYTGTEFYCKKCGQQFKLNKDVRIPADLYTTQNDIADEVISSSGGSWAVLQTDILQEILRRLTLLDSVRFGAVCKPWREVHKNQLRRPIQLPWLIAPGTGFSFLPLAKALPDFFVVVDRCQMPRKVLQTFSLSMRMFSPDDAVNVEALDDDSNPNYYRGKEVIASDKGWILMQAPNIITRYDIRQRSFLFNPISKVVVELPQHELKDCLVCLVVNSGVNSHNLDFVIVSQSSSTDGVIYLIKTGYDTWKRVYRNDDFERISSFTFCNGRIYGFKSCSNTLVSLNPFQDSPTTLDLIPMQNISSVAQQLDEDHKHAHIALLVESLGELFLVYVTFRRDVNGYESKIIVPSFEYLTVVELFKADFEKREWIKGDACNNCLADRVLFISENNCFSAAASEVGSKGGEIHLALMSEYKRDWFWLHVDLLGGQSPTCRMSECIYKPLRSCQPMWFQPQHNFARL